MSRWDLASPWGLVTFALPSKQSENGKDAGFGGDFRNPPFRLTIPSAKKGEESVPLRGVRKVPYFGATSYC